MSASCSTGNNYSFRSARHDRSTRTTPRRLRPNTRAPGALVRFESIRFISHRTRAARRSPIVCRVFGPQTTTRCRARSPFGSVWSSGGIYAGRSMGREDENGSLRTIDDRAACRVDAFARAACPRTRIAVEIVDKGTKYFRNIWRDRPGSRTRLESPTRP